MTINFRKYIAQIRNHIPDEIVNTYYHLPKSVFSVLWHRYPAKEMIIIGVTGTSGKTSTVSLIYHILKLSGLKAGMISTVKAIIGDKEYETGFHVTNPDAFQMQTLITEAKKQGLTHLVLEMSSHGLVQYRNFGTNTHIGVITNISHEHLDYHKNMRNYVLAKAKILKNVKYSVLNRDDRNFRTLVNLSSGRVISFGIKSQADFTPKSFPFTTSFPGQFNKYNCLAAIAVAKTLGIDDELIRKAVRNFKGVPGRLEYVKNNLGIKIIIDFAHKPDALENILKTAIKITGKKGKIIAVFGCAGLRDKTKRPIMGQIAGRLADFSILTAEDPRTENVNSIISQIARGVIKVKAKEVKSFYAYQNAKQKDQVNYFIRVPDRKKAINFALRKSAKKGDTIIFCGKGPEQTMCFGTKEYPWNEKQEIENALLIKNK